MAAFKVLLLLYIETKVIVTELLQNLKIFLFNIWNLLAWFYILISKNKINIEDLETEIEPGLPFVELDEPF